MLEVSTFPSVPPSDPSHDHRGLKDLLFGATVDAVRHRVKVPVLVMK